MQKTALADFIGELAREALIPATQHETRIGVAVLGFDLVITGMHLPEHGFTQSP